MPTAKLPQPYGLRIELIRAGGLSDPEALRILQAGDKEALISRVSGEIGWDGFLDYAKEEWLTVKTAVLSGYRFKFLTIGGLKDLLSIRFGKEDGVDYQFNGEEISALLLTQEERRALHALMPVNWQLVELPDREDQTAEIRIRHVLQPAASRSAE